MRRMSGGIFLTCSCGCNSKEVVRRNGGVFFKCLNCGRRGPEGRNETEARRLWNEMILWNEAIRNEG